LVAALERELGSPPAEVAISERHDRIEEGEGLIRAAFEQARRSGRPEWQRMSLAVLKNRILDLTRREFDERDWGAENIREFASLFPAVANLDLATKPASVTLLGDLPGQVVESELPLPVPGTRAEWRIRKDLWDAILDGRSGSVYVWDNERAVPVPPDAWSDDDPRPRLPTVGRDEMLGWRSAFRDNEAASATDPSVREALDHWLQSWLTAAALPHRIRIRWIIELKRRVRERLEAWFDERGIHRPRDYIEVANKASPAEASETERLRDLVVRCVRAMTREELDELRLPPSVLLRVRS
jgi:hypothetical protein